MIDIDRLLALEDIRHLKVRRPRRMRAGGPARIVELVATSLADCVTVHHGHCPEIAITSDTTATGST